MHSVSDSVSTRRTNLIASVILGLLIAFAVFACAPAPVPSVPVVVQSAPAALRPPDPVKKDPVPQEAVVGSARGHTYHRPDCEWAMKIHAGNRIEFQDVEEAVKKGYKPCRTCRPK